MAILRSMDGKFYNIPDDQLEGSLVPPEEVKEQLGNVGEMGGPPGPGGPTTMSVPGAVIQIYPGGGGGPGGGPGGAPSGQPAEAAVTPHGYCWRNCWSRNHWRNCWRNSCGY